MKRILFVCHGNICRSVMAEYVYKHLAEQAGVASMFEVSSAAVSTEETGNDIYPPAQRKLREKGVPFGHHAAHQITRAEYEAYDYIVCADQANIRRLGWLVGDTSLAASACVGRQSKVSLMMQWCGEQRDVADPWYTGDFETAYQDIYSACKGMLNILIYP